MVHFFITVMLMITSIGAVAMHEISYAPHDFYKSYKASPVHADSLYKLMLDDGIAVSDNALLKWLAAHHNLITTLAIQVVYGDLTNYASNVAAGNQFLAQAGYHNVSTHNFNFKLELGNNKKYWVKITGPNRFEQLNGLLCRPWGTPVTQEDHILLGVNRTKTYEAASRMARYLLYKKWKAEHKAFHVVVPATYLFCLTDEKRVDDAHCIIIEEHVDVLGTPEDYPELFLKLRAEITDFIKHVVIWNVTPEQFLVQPDGTIVYVDLEDPDNSNPDFFFNADYEKVKSNIRWGLSDFDKMCNKLYDLVGSK